MRLWRTGNIDDATKDGSHAGQGYFRAAPAGKKLDRLVEERVKDNIRPRQVVEESELQSGGGGELVEHDSSSDGERKNKLGRRKYGLAAARVVQEYLQAGTVLVQVGRLIK